MDTVPVWLRTQRTGVGRPAERTRAEVTAAAIAVADREGLAAVSMRRVAAELGTGAASLYRYVGSRDDLLDLMVDEVAGAYELPEPGGPWLPGLLEVCRQAQALMLRHRWLPELLLNSPALGPHGTDLLEHVLAVLAGHPADAGRKLEAFAVMTTLTAAFVLNELAGGSETRQRQGAYLAHVVAQGRHTHLTAALTGGGPMPAPRLEDTMTRVLRGLLGE
ncbi:TetR/AcrR family transcriptional regulator [Actinoplanes sp. RD1]|uniref:TetR/AcrR family transcriptional regulator n=1 Tax=Actinoplanes sp. RD1 TaxID=3064538 RepID=UPI002741EB31|nr:TetR/AcrR family transcriptional regulator [Actinoplanes sp. RD1]